MKLRSHSTLENQRRITRSVAKAQEKGKLFLKKLIKRTQTKKSPKPLISSISNLHSTTSQNFPTSENPLEFFAKVALEYMEFTQMEDQSEPTQEIRGDIDFCEETLAAAILLQITEDTIEYPGLQSGVKKTLGPDLNLPAEASNEIVGADSTSEEAVIGDLHLNQATPNTSLLKLTHDRASTSGETLTTRSAPVEITVPAAGGTCVAGKFKPPPCSLSSDAFKVNTIPTRPIDKHTLVSPLPSICPIPSIETTIATTSCVVPTFLVDGTNDVIRPRNLDTIDSPALFS